MKIYVIGNAVRYEDGEVVLTTAKNAISLIKEGNTRVGFKHDLITQKSFDVADIRNAANATYGATADDVILALSSLVFNDANGGGGGAVSSVNSQTEVVIIDLDSVLAQGTALTDGVFAISVSGGSATAVPIASETIGSYKAFSTTAIPSNYLWCNGATVLIATYPDLFAVIGNTFGGDGIVNFALPNMQDRFLKGDNGTNIGTVTGSNTLTVSNLPQHSHSLFVNNDTPDTGDSNGTYLSSQTDGGGGIMSTNLTNSSVAAVGSIGLIGSNQPHEHPNIAVRWAICFESVGVSGASPTPSLPQVLAVNGEYIVLTENSTIADFVAGQTHYYIGKADITFDYDLEPQPPNPAPADNVTIINLSPYLVTINSDTGNATYPLQYLQGLANTVVNDNGFWQVLGDYLDNIYDFQKTTDKGAVTTNAVIIRNNPDTYRTRYSILGQDVQRDDLGHRVSYYDNGITKTTNSNGKVWQLQAPDLSGNPNNSSFVVTARPNVTGVIAYLGDVANLVSQVTNVVNGNTNVETDLLVTSIIPANKLKVGDNIEVNATGSYGRGGAGSNSVFRIYLGTTLIGFSVSVNSANQALNTGAMKVNISFTVRSIGVTGSVVCGGQCWLGNIVAPIKNGQVFGTPTTTATTINTTVAQQIRVTHQFAALNVDNGITTLQNTIKINPS